MEPSTDAAVDPLYELAAEVSRSHLPDVRERRRIREGARVSLRRGARALEVGPMTLLRWERGEAEPTFEHALRYRAFLDALKEAVRDGV